MKQIFPDLWETDVENPAPGLTTHAYLLVRDDGNVLFYNTGHLHELDSMAELGGVACQLLSHRDELGDSIRLMHERFGTRLGGHVREQVEFSRIRTPDILFDERQVLFGNIDVIPTPGHSPGSTCFLVRSPHGRTYLFTGDTLYNSDDGWKAGYLRGSSDRDALIDSLEILRTPKPDVVISSAFSGAAGFREMSPDAWPGHVDRALEALRN